MGKGERNDPIYRHSIYLPTSVHHHTTRASDSDAMRDDRPERSDASALHRGMDMLRLHGCASAGRDGSSIPHTLLSAPFLPLRPLSEQTNTFLPPSPRRTATQLLPCPVRDQLVPTRRVCSRPTSSSCCLLVPRPDSSGIVVFARGEVCGRGGGSRKGVWLGGGAVLLGWEDEVGLLMYGYMILRRVLGSSRWGLG